MLYFLRSMAKPSHIRMLLAVGICTAVLALVTVVVLRTGGERKSPPVARLSDAANASLEQMRFSETKEGVKQWDLLAEKVVLDRTRDISLLSTPTMIFRPEEKSGNITVTAKSAEYLNKSRDIRMYGGVVAKNNLGTTFTTDHAVYNSTRALLVTDAPGRYVSPSMSVDGVGMEFDPATKDVRVFKQVSARVLPGKRQ